MQKLRSTIIAPTGEFYNLGDKSFVLPLDSFHCTLRYQVKRIISTKHVSARDNVKETKVLVIICE